MAQTIACDMHPLNVLRTLKYLKSELGIRQEKVDQWYQHWIELGFSSLQEKIVKHNKGGQYCFGEKLTIADVYLVPQMYNARRFNCDIEKFEPLNAIDARLQSLAAFKAAAPENQPDATK